MKVLFLIIAVLFYVQPAVAGGCDMAADQAAEQQFEHNMDTDHDCCDEGQAGPQEGCEHAIQCGTCTASVLVLAANLVTASALKGPHSWSDASYMLIPSQSFPPYRPPIS